MPAIRPRRLETRLLTKIVAVSAVYLAVAGLGPIKAQGTTSGQPASAPYVAQPPAPFNPMQGDLGRPYNLPPASRARIHQCAVEWQKMKMSGAANEMIWRVFATGCFTAENVKAPESSEPKQNR